VIELKTINNSFVTLETLKAFNDWMADIYKCRIAYIDNIMCYKQYAAETSWKNTTLSVKSVINNIPIWQHRLFVQYLRNNYQRKMQIGDVTRYVGSTEVAHRVSCTINLRTNQVIGIEGAGVQAANTPIEVKSSHGEAHIPIPEGFDGNLAYVELMVPYDVIYALHGREVGAEDIHGWEYSPGLVHPLMDAASYDLGNATTYGWTRPHALLFYQRFCRKGTNGRNTLKIDVAKSKAWVSVKTHADLFTGPFDIYLLDVENKVYPIEPLVEVVITCYKSGAQ
jgi:hypothetical protein